MTDEFPQFRFFPIDEASRPRQGAEFWVDHWWLVDAEDRIAFFVRLGFAAAQCNANDRAVRSLVKNNSLYEWVTDVRLVPVVFEPASVAEMNRRADRRAEQW